MMANKASLPEVQKAYPNGSVANTNLSANELKSVTNPTLGSPSDLGGNIVTQAKTASEITNQRVKDLEAEKTRAATAMATDLGATGETPAEALISAAKTRPTVGSTEEKIRTEMETSGATAELAKVKEQNIKVSVLSQELDNLSAEERTKIDALEQTGMSRGAIERESNVINREYASKKAVKNAELGVQTAMLNAYSGNYEAAKSMVGDIVEAYTYDQKQKVDDFDTLFTAYSGWVSSLDEKDQQILTDAREDAKTQLANDRVDKETVVSLMLDNQNAGILTTDTKEEATAKATAYSKSHPEVAQTVGSAETGYTMYDKYGNVIGTKGGGGVTTPTEDTVYDEDLLSEIKGGASPIQAANLIISGVGENLTEKEKSSILSRAKQIEKTFKESQNSNVFQDPNNPNASILKKNIFTTLSSSIYNTLFK
jgi:hypothetical protein